VSTLPTNPAPNTTYNGVVNSKGDSFRYVFNERITNPDGSLTVNAAHQYLLGPTALGDAIIGQAQCGATPTPPPLVPEVPWAVLMPIGALGALGAVGVFRRRRAGQSALDG